MRKPWYASRTVWLNAAAAALVALEASTGLLQPYVGDHFYAALAVALPVLNAMLRVITTQGIALRKENP